MKQSDAARYARMVIEAIDRGEGVRNPTALRECLEVLASAVERKSK